MLGRFVTVGLVCFLIGAGLAMFVGPWLHPAADEVLPGCPYLENGAFDAMPPEVVAVIGAYEAIRETLMRDSLDGVAVQAEVIVRALSPAEPKIASVAKRLAAEQDVESARRAFMRLNRLMEKHAQSLPRA
ncbi:MAG: hypothetical protein IAE97_13850 [Chthoniobacterales bacterium]|nr:hypothetical protein [Chthoniobacterales bacterium]